jgi:hypothetical protein
MSFINEAIASIPEQVVLFIGLGGLIGSFFCFLVGAGYQLSNLLNLPNKGKIYCLKRAMILSGIGMLLLTTTAVFTTVAVAGAITTLMFICAISLFAFGAFMLNYGIGLKDK